MKTIKPQSLGVLTRPFEFQRRFYLGVSTLSFIPLGADPALLPEVSMWKFLAEELGGDGVLEAGIPKRWSEFLVVGKACLAEPKTACRVSVRLGDREKVLHVYGDRYWEGTGFSEPVAFQQMPLDWRQAYGGDGYPRNPLGKGFASPAPGERPPLPNIQAPAQPITSPNQRPEPAGFGPIDLTWPQRMGLTGTHDQRWLQEDFPGFARDIDWHFFNLASPDQQFDAPLRGDEPYQLENLHPEHPLLSGRLPEIATRCFITRLQSEQTVFEEVETRLMTVWLFPHAARAVLIHQGVVPINDEDGADVLHLIAGAEWLHEAKGPWHYQTVLDARLDKEKGPLLSLRDRDLLPEGLKSKDPALEQAMVGLAGEGLMRRNQRAGAEQRIAETRATVARHGLDPDEYGPQPLPPDPPPPDLDELPDFVAHWQAEAERYKAEAAAEQTRNEANKDQLLTESGIDRAEWQAGEETAGRGPPSFSEAAEVETLEKLSEEDRKSGLEDSPADALLGDPAWRAMIRTAEQRFREGYQKGAHHQKPAFAMSSEQNAARRAEVLQAHARGESLAQRDFTGIDLSGMALPGIDLSGCFLESAKLDGTDLSGARLHGAVLAHASLRDARLDGADLQDANLGGGQLQGASLRQADLRQAQCTKADFSGAQAQAALLDRADLTGVHFDRTDFSDVRGEQLNFLECDLRGLRLHGAQLRKCNFLMVNVSGIDFGSAVLDGSVFVAAKGLNCQFQAAQLINMRLVKDCDFSGSDFSHSVLRTANLRGTRLEGCNFSHAVLDDADLSECLLYKADLYRAVGRSSRFVKADLREARVVAANLMGAMLSRADVRGADFTGANLFQADLARCHGDRATRFTDALNTKARIYQRHVETAT